MPGSRESAIRSLLVRSAAALPHGPETRLHDPVGGFRASPAWAEYVAGDAPTWLHALLAHMPAEDVRAALLADPEVPALLARARRRRRR